MNNWIQTVTGIAFDLEEPRPDMVCLLDIAHALARQCRFNGHTPKHYSVAQHSVLVSQMCPPRTQKFGQLHDAAETYIGDVVSPVKRLLYDVRDPEAHNVLRAVETRILSAILEHFGVDWPSDSDQQLVKKIDRIVLATEQRAFLPDPPTPWEMLEGVEPLTGGLRAFDAVEAKALFLERALEVGLR